MIRTVLLTGTRAPATLDLARRLWREGVRVIGADSMHVPLGRFSRAFSSHHRVPPPRQDRAGFLNAIGELARRESVDLIWPTCEEIFHLAKGREALREVSGVFCPSFEVLDQLHHKLRFAEWVRDFGGERVRSPDFWEGSRAPKQGERLVWKPIYSRFAARTRFDPPEKLDGWMAQRFVTGDEFSTWALCVEGEIRVLTQYRCPVRSGRGAGCAFEPFWSAEASEFTAAVARRLSYTGSLAFDFMESKGEERTSVLECNPRLTSGLHVLRPEVELSELLADRTEPLPPPQQSGQLLLPVLYAAPNLAGTSPDVISSTDDGAPTWTQGLTMLELLWRTVRHRISLLEASTWDIEYNGD